MWVGDLVWNKLRAQLWARGRISGYYTIRRSELRECRKSDRKLSIGHMFLGNLSSVDGVSVQFKKDVDGVDYLHFMFGSTSRRSLKPMPHGLPGVASSMNLPNSG